MRSALELLRIILIFAFLGALGWLIIQGIYEVNGVNENYSWLGGVANIIIAVCFISK